MDSYWLAAGSRCSDAGDGLNCSLCVGGVQEPFDRFEMSQALDALYSNVSIQEVPSCLCEIWFVFLVLRSSKSSLVTAAASWERIGGSLQGVRGMNLAPAKARMLARQQCPAASL